MASNKYIAMVMLVVVVVLVLVEVVVVVVVVPVIVYVKLTPLDIVESTGRGGESRILALVDSRFRVDGQNHAGPL